MDKTVSTASYVTSGAVVAAGQFTLQDLAVWVGIVTAIGTFLLNAYYKYLERKDRLAERDRK